MSLEELFAEASKGPARPIGVPVSSIDELRRLPFSELQRLRKLPGADQALLGPIEHEAWAKDFTHYSPVSAALSLPWMIPAYSAGKAMGLTNARSPASLAEMGAGYSGLWQGLLPHLLGRR